MEAGATNGKNAAGEEPLATAFERLSSFMGGEHDWAEEAEQDEGVPSSELFADILPEEPDTRDDAARRVAELPDDARLTVVLRKCPQIFGPHDVNKLFSGIPVADILILRPQDGGKVCCVDFADRKDLAEALRRNPADIGKAGVELSLAADDQSFHKLLQIMQQQHAAPPPPPPRGSPPRNQFPPRGFQPPPDRGPMPGPPGRGAPREMHGGGRGRGFHGYPAGDRFSSEGGRRSSFEDTGRRPSFEETGRRPSFEASGHHRPQFRPQFDGPPQPQFDGPQLQRRSFDDFRGGRGSGWRPNDGPPQQRAPPGGMHHLPPPPPYGHPPPRGGRGPGPSGFRRMDGPPPQPWMDGGAPRPGGDRSMMGPVNMRGPVPPGGPPGHGFGSGASRQHPSSGPLHHPPPANPAEPPPGASERPRLKLAPRTKPIGEGAADDASSVSHHGQKPNPFGNAKPIDTAAKLEEIERKHTKAEAELQQPHSHKPSEPPSLDFLHSALVGPPQCGSSPNSIKSPPQKRSSATPTSSPSLMRPPGL